MVKLRDRVAKLATNFGIPNVRSLFIRTRTQDGDTSYLEVIPIPIITEISNSQDRMNGISGLSGAAQFFDVKGVSRKYTLQQLEYEAVDYIIDGRLDTHGQLQGGIICQLVSITENSITWDLRLQQKLGEQSLYS